MTRKNFVHQKIRNAKPQDLIPLQLRLPKILLKDVKKYGDPTKVIRRSLEYTEKAKYMLALKEIIAEIRKQIELLQLEEELDQYHAELLENYRNIYFQLKDARVLKLGTKIFGKPNAQNDHPI